MSLALDADQHALAASVAAFAQRHAPLSATRAQLDEEGAHERLWQRMVAAGLHVMHLPERFGGDACGLAMLAVVVEQFGKALVPGPYLPTVLAGSVAAAADAGDELLAAFAAGATGALGAGGTLTAHQRPDGWVVTGLSDPAVGLPGAAMIVVAAQRPGRAEPLWFWLDAASLDGPTGGVIAADAVDLTRPVGRLRLTQHPIAANSVLTGITPAVADLIGISLLAAEASGIAAWCLDTAVDYIRTRTQFGRAIGAFQAVQHRAALMLVRAEVIKAAAWDVARAAGQSVRQRQLATAHAAVTALPAVVDQALECVGLLGAIGFSWEHDAHLYWRRAISLAALAGAEDTWTARLGQIALLTERDFSFIDADTLPELRARVGAVLDDVLRIPDDEQPSSGWAPARGGARRARLADAGLVAPHYPAPFGLDAGPTEQAVVDAEFRCRGLTPPRMGIGEWVLPTLLAHGTAAQHDRFVIPTLRGRIVWCQLFSEPAAGSDLAGLTTRAVRVDGGWRLTGQKVWNTQAAAADWGVCLARTAPDAPKHAGLTYFLLPMRAPGVEVRRVRQATGVWEFHEVFLDQAFVPDDCVVAEPGDGWRLAVGTLSHERSAMGNADFGHGSAALVRGLIERGDHACTRDAAVRTLGRNTARECAVAALNLRDALGRISGGDAAAIASVRKVFHAIAQRDGARDMLGLLGPLGSLGGAEMPYAEDYLGVPAVLIGGGTIEIQLNVIAQRVLGLPR
ncbi:acyl-CoA dehydrogenase family protein [Nocardia sp. NPDC051052]|uniref:acyl-CoA dehydrogenase family protein n=1 Tax=Nocardia sp. NPDC051052 TaxID=3364322 RepID=UPI00378AD969